MFTIIISVAYVLWILWLIFKLRDIKEHPKKYDTVKGYEAYKNSIWYWPAKKAYGKSNTPDNSGMASAPGSILFLAWYLLSTMYQYFLANYKNSEVVAFAGEHIFNFASWALFLIYSFLMGEYLTMFSRNPMAICNNYHHIFRHDDRSDALRKMTLIVLISTAIIFPLRILSINNHGLADDVKIVYHPFLSIKEETFIYSEVETEFVYDESGENVEHCYLINPSGQRFDLYASYVTMPDEKNALLDFVMPFI